MDIIGTPTLIPEGYDVRKGYSKGDYEFSNLDWEAVRSTIENFRSRGIVNSSVNSSLLTSAEQ